MFLPLNLVNGLILLSKLGTYKTINLPRPPGGVVRYTLGVLVIH